MPHATKTCWVTALPSSLGWMAILGKGRLVEQLVFGYPTRAKAIAALDKGISHHAGPIGNRVFGGADIPVCPAFNGRQECLPHHGEKCDLVRRLQAYAEGEPEDFSDIQVDLDGMSRFRRRVFEACRKIPYGKTLSYAELAVTAGFPKAFRAVGNCMAANRVPLIIPCHRVVCSNGQIGRFSAPGGEQMKRRLLQIEAPDWLSRVSRHGGADIPVCHKKSSS